MGLGDCLAYLVAGFHGGPCLLYRGIGGAFLLPEGRYLAPFISLLDPDIRGILCHGRGIGHRYAVSIWHQLVTLLGCRC